MRLPRVGSAVLVRDGDRVLLGRRNKDPNRGKWILPGGRVEPFESLEEAAKREILEETGLVIDVGERIGVFEIISPPDEHRVIVFSWGRPLRGLPRPASDLSEVRFVEREELSRLDVAPIVRDVLKKIGWLGTEGETKVPEEPIAASG